MKISVMVATDGSATGRKSSLYAVRLAQVLPLKVTLVHVVRSLGRLGYRMIPDFQMEMIGEGARSHAAGVLDLGAAALDGAGLEVNRSLLLQGYAGQELCEAAEAEDVGLVLLGRHGHGDLRELFYGSTCSHVLTYCRRPVLVVNRDAQVNSVEEGDGPLRVLVAMDESDATTRVLDYLEGIASRFTAAVELTLCYVVHRERPDLKHMPSGLRYEALNRLRIAGDDVLAVATGRMQAAGYQVRHLVEEGSVGKTLCRLAAAEHHEVVMLGRRELGDEYQRTLGAVCRYVAHRCPTHVWVVP